MKRPATRATKRARAVAGVDPRQLPPGTAYPCDDPRVGTRGRGKRAAGTILACATPPKGQRGRFYAVGEIEKGATIDREARASAAAREALRERYEGAEFDARRPKRKPRPTAKRAPREKVYRGEVVDLRPPHAFDPDAFDPNTRGQAANDFDGLRRVVHPAPTRSSRPVRALPAPRAQRREELPLPRPVFMRRTPELPLPPPEGGLRRGSAQDPGARRPSSRDEWLTALSRYGTRRVTRALGDALALRSASARWATEVERGERHRAEVVGPHLMRSTIRTPTPRLVFVVHHGSGNNSFRAQYPSVELAVEPDGSFVQRVDPVITETLYQSAEESIEGPKVPVSLSGLTVAEGWELVIAHVRAALTGAPPVLLTLTRPA